MNPNMEPIRSKGDYSSVPSPMTDKKKSKPSKHKEVATNILKKEGEGQKVRETKIQATELARAKLPIKKVTTQIGELAAKKTKTGEVKLTNLDETQKISKAILYSNMQKLLSEFENTCFIRTISDPEFELKNVIEEKLEVEKDPSKIEKRYWASASAIQEDCPVTLHEGEQGSRDRTGLVLGSGVKTGGFAIADMATANIPSHLQPAEGKDYYPANFPPIAHMPLLHDLQQKQDVNLAKKILGIEEAMLNQNQTEVNRINRLPKHRLLEEAESFVWNAFDSNSPNHHLLLHRLPQEYKSSYTYADVKASMTALKTKSKAAPQEYTEAKIRYMPKDILGVFVYDSPESKKRGKAFQEKLSALNIHVPIVTYHPSGTIEVYESVEDMPKSKDVSTLPHKGSADFEELVIKYYSILDNRSLDRSKLQSFATVKHWLSRQPDYSSDWKNEVEDPRFHEVYLEVCKKLL